MVNWVAKEHRWTFIDGKYAAVEDIIDVLKVSLGGVRPCVRARGRAKGRVGQRVERVLRVGAEWVLSGC